ncbi:uncharacterized protein LOC142711556 isoform X2 [Rhinoderma darwinii]|uniref:uncharacterized protein LOC142711556 isoform X2 n=1 Tax=Rhinoderma darwinii TaxID=43563 RepID=UPI003F67843A
MRDRSDRLRSALIFAAKLRQLLTGEGYVLLKIFGDSGGCSWITGPATVRRTHNSTPSSIQEKKIDQTILDLTREINHLLTGEVPIRYEDITVCFSSEEWEYIGGHRDRYKDIMMENTILLNSIGDQNIKIFHNTTLEKIRDLKTRDRDGNHILHLTEEIIHLLTEEKYILIWNHGNHTTPSGTDQVLGGLITEPSPPSLIHEWKNDEKILDLTNKIVHLLTGEVPVRHEDITVCFSMEEWEYIEGHRDLYKDVMMEDHRDRTPPDNSSLKFIGENPFECPKLGKDSSESSGLLAHNPPPHREVKSTKSFHNQPNSRKHEKSQKEQTVGPCCICGKPLQGTAASSGSKKFCGKCLSDKRSNETKRQFSCLECGSTFSNKGSLEVHLRVHTLSKIFPCSECKNVFTNNTSLETHMRVHTGEKPYTCSECGKCFRNTGNLQAHYRFHTGERPFPCTECNKTFRYKSHLVAHLRYHTGQTLPCSECGKCFVYQSHLVKHLRIHTGEKPYKCLECGKSFHRTSQLSQHAMIHTGESPFKCDGCDKCFRFPSDLFRHQKIHTGEKSFSCSECGKGFTRRTSLAQHQMIHTGEKPYSCPECGKPFMTYNYMLRHLRTHNRKV